MPLRLLSLMLCIVLTVQAENTDFEYLADASYGEIEQLEHLIKHPRSFSWFAQGSRIYKVGGYSASALLLDGDMNIIDLREKNKNSYCSDEQLDGGVEIEYLKINETVVRMVQRCYEYSSMVPFSPKKHVIALSPESNEGKAYMMEILEAGDYMNLIDVPTTEEESRSHAAFPSRPMGFSADGYSKIIFELSDEGIKRKAEIKTEKEADFKRIKAQAL